MHRGSQRAGRLLATAYWLALTAKRDISIIPA